MVRLKNRKPQYVFRIGGRVGRSVLSNMSVITSIGKETARDLARRGARVILACRDVDRANTARDEIVASTGNQDVLVRKLDLASLSSVREFSKQILESEPRLDVLINNAGVAGIDKIMTEDNLVLGMQANHFAPFLLTNLLAVKYRYQQGIDTHISILTSVAGLLKESAPSRIVNVSSLMHKYCKLDLENLNCEKSFNKTDVYSVSKLNNILMTSELSRRLKGTGVTANSLHPGVIKTEIMRQMSPLMLAATNFFMGIFAKGSLRSKRFENLCVRPCNHNAVEGAQTTIYLAVSEEVEGVTGKYFADCKVTKGTGRFGLLVWGSVEMVAETKWAFGEAWYHAVQYADIPDMLIALTTDKYSLNRVNLLNKSGTRLIWDLVLILEMDGE
uniref:Uncharacterized protein n=1 Tax=Timema cristinae TaxID=61476 RepID=A0A7R9CFG8_TIMCR|nr:unnamed protein product [Timema cristinae]